VTAVASRKRTQLAIRLANVDHVAAVPSRTLGASSLELNSVDAVTATTSVPYANGPGVVKWPTAENWTALPPLGVVAETTGAVPLRTAWRSVPDLSAQAVTVAAASLARSQRDLPASVAGSIGGGGTPSMSIPQNPGSPAGGGSAASSTDGLGAAMLRL
jgi:hypothetical protein